MPMSSSWSNYPPRRGLYLFPLMMLRASPSSACPHVSWRRSFAGGLLMRSCTEGAFASSPAAAFPFPPGGMYTEASWSCRAVPPALAEATERMRDVELSASSTPLHVRLLRTLAQAPPALGRWSRSVGVGPGWEELHVVTVAGRDEVEAPEPKHRVRREWAWLVCHPENKRERRQDVTQHASYLARQLSVS